MPDADYALRTMTREDLDLAVEYAAAEGWNPGLGDADAFFTADPGGYLIGELGDGELREPVSCISAVSYHGRFGFVGFYIVRPEYRGQGLGLTIWNAGMERLRGHLIGLDGVVDQQENYRRSGFVLAHRNVRRSCAAFDAEVADGVVRLSPTDAERLGPCDRWVFPEERTAFLRSWLGRPHVGAFGFERDGRLVGYTVVRPCREGWKIGPLAADDEATAEALFAAASRHAAHTERAVRPDATDAPTVYLDVPETNARACALADRHGMDTVFETARMYTGSPPPLDLTRLYGVTTFELG